MFIKILILIGIILLIVFGFQIRGSYHKQEQYTISVIPINKGLNTLSINSLVASYPSILYVGTKEGVFKSIDRGDSWLPINEGLGDFHEIKKLQYVEEMDNSDTIYLLTAGILFRSKNGGIRWERVTPFYCIQNKRRITFPSVKDFFISDAETATWQTSIYALTYGKAPSLEEMKKGEQLYDKIYVANHKFLRGCGLKINDLCEEDLCEDWFSSPYVRNYSFDSPAGGLEKILIIDEYRGIILGRETGPIFFLSKDRGNSWRWLNFNEFGEDVSVLDVRSSVWYAKGNIKYIYASIKTEKGKLFLKSEDYGDTWKEVSRGERIPEIFITSCYSGSGCNITGFTRIGKNYYLVRSTDYGKSWKISKNFLPEEIVERALTINLPLSTFFFDTFVSDPELENTLYLGTKNRGVFRIVISKE